MPGFAERTLGDVLTALASDAASPGSGAAAAVALAFAAACAGKALAISRKHRPPEEYLQIAEKRVADITHRSLERADADARLFEQFIHHQDARTTTELLRADDSSAAVVQELSAVLDEIEAAIHPVVAGDIVAARALLAAAQQIEERIRKENQRALRPARS